jgi:hypothetical protein
MRHLEVHRAKNELIFMQYSSTRNQLQGFVGQVNILRKIQVYQHFQILDIFHSGIGD